MENSPPKENLHDEEPDALDPSKGEIPGYPDISEKKEEAEKNPQPVEKIEPEAELAGELKIRSDSARDLLVGFRKANIRSLGATEKKEIADALKVLKTEEGVESAEKVVEKIIEARTEVIKGENVKWADTDKRIVRYMGNVIAADGAETKRAIFLRNNGPSSFENYLNEVEKIAPDKGDQKGGVAELKQEIVRIKTGAPEVKAEPTAEPAKPEAAPAAANPEPAPAAENASVEKTSVTKEKKRKPRVKKSAEKIEIEEPELGFAKEPWAEQEEQVIEGAKGVEFAETLKNNLDKYLEDNLKKAYNSFALKWFEDHKAEIAQKNIAVDSVTEDWKINYVLGKKESGGLELKDQARSAEYNADYGKNIERIGILRAELSKPQMHPESQFLLLDYLQDIIDKGKREAKKFYKPEDKASMAEFDKRVDQLKGVYAMEKEMAKKIFNIEEADLIKQAKQEVVEKNPNYIERADYVKNAKPEYLNKENADAFKKGKTEIKKNTELPLLKKEWDDFQKLTKKQQKRLSKDLGFQLRTEDEFNAAILENAKSQGISQDSFYGLLQQGYRPYQKEKKGWFSRKPKSMIKSNGEAVLWDEKFDDTIKQIGEQYWEKIDAQSREQFFGPKWDTAFDKAVRVQKEKIIARTARSPERTVESIEKSFNDAKERIMADYIKKRAEKQPKTAEQLSAISAEFKENEKPVDMGKFMGDVLFSRGKLENLTGNWQKDKATIKDYISNDLGFEISSSSLKGITAERYKESFKNKTGLLYLFLGFLDHVIKKSKEKEK